MNFLSESKSTEWQGEILLGLDQRREVQRVTAPPYRWICSLAIEFPEPVYYPLGTLEGPSKRWENLKPTLTGCGSGLLISPKHILTSAHVLAGLKKVRNQQTGKYQFQTVLAKRVKAIPARNMVDKDKPQPFGQFSSQRAFISPTFKTVFEVPRSTLTRARVRKGLAHDFGIIELKDRTEPHRLAPGQGIGWWGESPTQQIQCVHPRMANTLQGKQVFLSGFPGDKGPTPCSSMWRSTDKIIKVFPNFGYGPENLLMYEADTSAGMSGSPVWIKDKKGVLRLVAIHSSFLDFHKKNSKGKRRANVGTLIRPEMLRLFQFWGVNYQEILF